MSILRRAAAVSALLVGTAATVIVPATPASAASLELNTFTSVGSTSMSICAKATFNSAFVQNVTLALKVGGAEHFDLAGVNPLVASPVSPSLTNSTTLCATFALIAGSSVNASYTAEVVGLAPTPFFGSCAGDVVRIFGGGAATVKTC